MPLSPDAKKMFSWNDESRHAPISTEVEGNGFRTACRCGYPGRLVTSSPSHSYNSTKVHVENENRREEEGGEKVEGADYQGNGEPPRAVRRAARAASTPSRPGTVPRSRSQGTPGTPCGCGCGEPSGGLFRPGHDSKLLSRLLTGIKAGSITLTEAHEEMTLIGTSEVLREKLAKKVAA
jgi:hypothetical protein